MQRLPNMDMVVMDMVNMDMMDIDMDMVDMDMVYMDMVDIDMVDMDIADMVDNNNEDSTDIGGLDNIKGSPYLHSFSDIITDCSGRGFYALPP